MIERVIQKSLEQALGRQAAVALIGPRQVGKTTLAHAVAAGRPSLYLDLESRADRAKLAEPELFLARHEDDDGRPLVAGRFSGQFFGHR
jgi:predicted AAA+ superfamily ATPase